MDCKLTAWVNDVKSDPGRNFRIVMAGNGMHAACDAAILPACPSQSSAATRMTLSLFPQEPRVALATGAWLLRGYALDAAPALLAGIDQVLAQAPLRHMVTASGHRMSVAMSNCGALGWVSDQAGYRYTPHDPASGRPWPAMPDAFSTLAARAALDAGYAQFAPDACLVNRYEAGTRLSLHQDRNERDFSQPIVSLSLGVSAAFLFGGARRQDKPRRVELNHGDVVVWGGPSRLHFHGVAELPAAQHAATGSCRFNLTLRKAG